MARYGNSRRFGYRPPRQVRIPSAHPGKGFSTYGFSSAFGYHPNGTPHPDGAEPTGAIPGTYDPALEAQKRAAERGESDTLGDIRTERHFGRKDLRLALRDIHTTVARKRQQQGIDYGRGNERIANQEADTRQRAARTSQDFQTKLAEISRQFGELGHRQGEAANAAGVNDAGTSAASAAARARQQAFAEAPIHTAQGRLQEDLYTALSRLGTSREQLSQDYGIASSQLQQNRDRERAAARRDFGRQKFELGRKEQRTKREGAITPVDILEQEIWEGKQNHPGAYAARARRGQTNGNKRKGRK